MPILQWRRRHEPTRDELDQSLREQHADRTIKRIDRLVSDLERVVTELNTIAGRFPHAEE